MLIWRYTEGPHVEECTLTEALDRVTNPVNGDNRSSKQSSQITCKARRSKHNLKFEK
jgi:hypothetical protein